MREDPLDCGGVERQRQIHASIILSPAEGTDHTRATEGTDNIKGISRMRKLLIVGLVLVSSFTLRANQEARDL